MLSLALPIYVADCNRHVPLVFVFTIMLSCSPWYLDYSCNGSPPTVHCSVGIEGGKDTTENFIRTVISKNSKPTLRREGPVSDPSIVSALNETVVNTTLAASE